MQQCSILYLCPAKVLSTCKVLLLCTSAQQSRIHQVQGTVKHKLTPQNSPKGNRNAVDNNVWEFIKTGEYIRPTKSKSTGSISGGKLAKQNAIAAGRRSSLEIMPSMNYGSHMSPIAFSNNSFSSMANQFVVSPVSDGYNYNFDILQSAPIQSSANIYPSPEVSQSDVYKTVYTDNTYFQLPQADCLYDIEGNNEPVTFESSFNFGDYQLCNL
jgi:hypothetical protein